MSEAQWRSLVENCPDLVAVIDAAGRVLHTDGTALPNLVAVLVRTDTGADSGNCSVPVAMTVAGQSTTARTASSEGKGPLGPRATTTCRG